jgi:YXWGXW repeat-containing protein
MTSSTRSVFSLRAGIGAIAAIFTAAMLNGCIVQPARVYAPPPPPPVYAPPPPPVYQPPPPQVAVAVEAPGVEVALTAPEPPPPLPDYEQPPCPDDGYLWTPGYWHWAPGGYYWVPGTWVQPPQVGLLWTPGYWAFAGGVYGFHAGYWGPHVGFYGGVNYGFGYVGVGFVGGRWDGNHYAYNRAVNNVNTTVIHNTYNVTVVNNVTVNKVSYNGGGGGLNAAPTAQERSYASESHVPPTAAQVSHVQLAASNPALQARANGGHPAIAATARPAAFTGPGVIGAHGSTPMHPQTFAPTVAHANGPATGANGVNAGGSGAKLLPNQLGKSMPGNGAAAPKGSLYAQATTTPPKSTVKQGSGKPPPKVNENKQHEPEGDKPHS